MDKQFVYTLRALVLLAFSILVREWYLYSSEPEFNIYWMGFVSFGIFVGAIWTFTLKPSKSEPNS